MVLGGRPPGRVGRRRISREKGPFGAPSSRSLAGMPSAPRSSSGGSSSGRRRPAGAAPDGRRPGGAGPVVGLERARAPALRVVLARSRSAIRGSGARSVRVAIRAPRSASRRRSSSSADRRSGARAGTRERSGRTPPRARPAGRRLVEVRRGAARPGPGPRRRPARARGARARHARPVAEPTHGRRPELGRPGPPRRRPASTRAARGALGHLAPTRWTAARDDHDAGRTTRRQTEEWVRVDEVRDEATSAVARGRRPRPDAEPRQARRGRGRGRGPS